MEWGACEIAPINDLGLAPMGSSDTIPAPLQPRSRPLRGNHDRLDSAVLRLRPGKPDRSFRPGMGRPAAPSGGTGRVRSARKQPRPLLSLIEFPSQDSDLFSARC